MQYLVLFNEQGKPDKAKEFHTTDKNFTAGSFFTLSNGKLVYEYKIVEANSEANAIVEALKFIQ